MDSRTGSSGDPHSRRDSEDLAILKALGLLEGKLTSLINNGLQSVHDSISQLKDSHNAAQLKQAEKNATFADRDRVEALARRVDVTQAEMVQLHMATTSGAADRTAIRQSLAELERAGAKSKTKLLTDSLGWLIAGGFLSAGIILTYILTHLH